MTQQPSAHFIGRIPDEKRTDMSGFSDIMDSEVTYRELNFNDLEGYKALMTAEYPNGYVGLLFKDIVNDKSEVYYRMGAFVGEKLVGLIICIVKFLSVRSQSDLENGLSAQTGKKLSYIPIIAVADGYKRKGVGSKLLKDLFDSIATTVFFHVPAKNVVAQQFFEAIGCNAKATLRRYFADNEDAIVYARE
ncbi:hypothetical protein QR680_000700 [Steinernema hermaphroditum]|uniref:N-acetyltransferase domain-containing protein n=1 Tax=Steinernema hermaphroditum TaxID=289476 RepID=A0AA39GVJ6_9BILA|nr:hypothetical protein QR680_000700 [Steinernema hermaphroditum]